MPSRKRTSPAFPNCAVPGSGIRFPQLISPHALCFVGALYTLPVFLLMRAEPVSDVSYFFPAKMFPHPGEQRFLVVSPSVISVIFLALASCSAAVSIRRADCTSARFNVLPFSSVSEILLYFCSSLSKAVSTVAPFPEPLYLPFTSL